MKVGAASVCITPPAGVVLEGYAARKGVAGGVHDDLHASTIWIEFDNRVFILTSLDLLGIPRDLYSEVRKKISERFGVPFDNFLLAATHTHSGPALIGLQDGNELNEFWLKLLPHYVMESIEMAKLNVERCYMMIGSIEEKDVGKNRRKTEGLIDPNLTVASFWKEESNSCKALIVNYACHPTVLDHTNLMISSDFVGSLRKTIRSFDDFKDCVVLFFNGAEGDVNIGYSAEKSALGERIEVQRNFETARKVGKVLAFDTMLALSKGESVDEKQPVFSMYREIKIPVRKSRTPEEIEKELSTASDDLEIFFLKEELRASKTLPREVQLPLQLIKLPKLIIFSLPVEPFSEIGLILRNLVKNGYSMVVSMANGWYGYLPTEEAFKNGGYETRFSSWSFLSEDASKDIVRVFKSMLEEGRRYE